MKKNSKATVRLIPAAEVAKRSGEPYDTINHWARMGLLPYQKRGRTRLFPAAKSKTLCRRIRELQNEDCNLAAIRRILAKEKIED